MRVEEISTWVEDARKAFASASDLDSLKAARLAHSGDKSPIALASRALGSLSPEDKASFGKVIGEAKAAIAQSLADATALLEAERDRKVLLEEVVDITLPVNRSHRGGLHPITIIKNEVSDFFIEQGLQWKKGQSLNQDGSTLMRSIFQQITQPVRCKIHFSSSQLNQEWCYVHILHQFRFAQC